MTAHRVTIAHDACTTHHVDADNKESAVSAAFEAVGVTLCHKCSDQIELADPIHAVCVENLETGEFDDDVDPPHEVVSLRIRIAELEAHISAQQSAPALKDHEIALIVNQLRDVAKEFHATEQLRERIVHIIVPVLRQHGRTAQDVFPSRVMDLLKEVANRNPGPHKAPWEDDQGMPMQDDADAAIAWIRARSCAARKPLTDERPALVWPKARDVGRIGDMGKGAHLRVGLDSDNDVYVSVWDDDGGASVEFCNPGAGGGGQSSRTRAALIALMVAIEADNAEKPSRDWWAVRNGINGLEVAGK